MARSSSALRTEPQSFSDVASARYERRRPETTVLYELVQNHLEAFLAESCEKHGKPLPRYVEQEFRAYLKCGILSYGFLRAECSSCGEEMVVAFSCKKRGLCPSCNARRMCNTAAHLVDRVFPDVPVRQWVLSTPFELRFLLARRIDAFNQLMRVFADEVMRAQRREAKDLGLRRVRAAGASFPQRFGSALQLNPHIHAVLCDGVFGFGDTDEEATFHRLPPPGPQTLAVICQRVHRGLCRWLRNKGLLRDKADVHNNEAPELHPIEACTQGSLRIGPLAQLTTRSDSNQGDDADDIEPLRPSRKSRGRYFAEVCGFSIHAGVTAAAGNLHGRELLLRYCARPPLALGRLSKLPTTAEKSADSLPWCFCCSLSKSKRRCSGRGASPKPTDRLSGDAADSSGKRTTPRKRTRAENRHATAARQRPHAEPNQRSEFDRSGKGFRCSLVSPSGSALVSQHER